MDQDQALLEPDQSGRRSPAGPGQDPLQLLADPLPGLRRELGLAFNSGSPDRWRPGPLPRPPGRPPDPRPG